MTSSLVTLIIPLIAVIEILLRLLSFPLLFKSSILVLLLFFSTGINGLIIYKMLCVITKSSELITSVFWEKQIDFRIFCIHI